MTGERAFGTEIPRRVPWATARISEACRLRVRGFAGRFSLDCAKGLARAPGATVSSFCRSLKMRGRCNRGDGPDCCGFPQYRWSSAAPSRSSGGPMTLANLGGVGLLFGGYIVERRTRPPRLAGRPAISRPGGWAVHERARTWRARAKHPQNTNITLRSAEGRANCLTNWWADEGGMGP